MAAGLTLDQKRILDALNTRWTAFRIRYAGGRWRASRRDGTGEPLRGLTPDDLTAAMRNPRTAWPTADETAFANVAKAWSAAYSLRYEAGMYRARFRYDDETELEAGTLAGLDSALRAHWSRVSLGRHAGTPWGSR